MLYAAIDWNFSDYYALILDEEDNEIGTLHTTHTPGGINELTNFIQAAAKLDQKEQIACLVKPSNGLLISLLIEKGLKVFIISPHTIDTFRHILGTVETRNDAYLMAKIGQRELENLAWVDAHGKIIDARHEGLCVTKMNSHVHRVKALNEAVASFLSPDHFISYGNPMRQEVALTFDDGPDPIYTAQILDILQRYRVQATFFCVGLQAQCHPELVKKEYEQQHLVANHTWSHPLLHSLLPEQIDWELTSNIEIIEQLIGVQPAFFRPPYCSFDLKTLESANRLDLTTVLWDVDPSDWKCPGVQAIVSTILNQVENGSIILMHDGGGNRSQTVDALPLIIEGLLKNDFRLLTLQQLQANLYR